MADGSVECSECGRQRWQGDRFCAQCGAEFSADASGVIDVDGLTVGDGQAAPKSNWRDGLRGMGVLAAVLALLFGGLYLASSGGDEAADDEPVEDAEADEIDLDGDPGVTPVPPTPTPEPEPTEEPDPDADTTPTPRPTPFLAQAPIAEVLQGLDVGARWLVTPNLSGRLVAHDLTTGDAKLVNDQRNFGEQLFFSEGTIEFNFGSDVSYLREWEDLNEAVELPGAFFSAYRDPEVGHVILVTTREDADQVTAYAVDTGETRPVPLEGSLFATGAGFGFSFFGRGAAALSSAFVIVVGDDSWGWTWNDGWQLIAEGEAVQPDADHLVMRRCDGPVTCRFDLVDYEGRTLVDSIPFKGIPAVLSPDAQTIIGPGEPNPQIYFSPDVQSLVLTDVESGESMDVPISSAFPSLHWTPNSKYVILTSWDRSLVIDAVEGAVVGEARGRTNDPFGSLGFTDDFVLPEEP